MAAAPEGRRPLRGPGDLLNLRVHAIIDGLAVGGAEMLLCELAAVAPAADIDLSVSFLMGAKGYHATGRLRAAGVEPTEIGIGALSPRALLQVRRDIARVRPDVVHTHLGYSDLLGTLAARSLGIPAVTTIHSMVWNSESRAERVKEVLMTGARRRVANRVISVSDVARDTYLAEGRDKPERVVVVRNGVRGITEPGAGAALRAELGLPDDAIVVTMISTLRHEKAHDVAIAAVGAVREHDPRVHLLIAGDGYLRDEIAAWSAPYGDGVRRLGFRDDVMALLDATDIVIHPSHYDALPTTLIEAGAAAVPVLASDVGGIPEIVVDGETGVLVPDTPRPEPYSRALADLIADPDRRAALGAAARERFEREFSADAWVHRLRGVYDEVTGRG